MMLRALVYRLVYLPIKLLLAKSGYSLSKFEYVSNTHNPWEDMNRLLVNRSTPVIFDIGANTGQTVDTFLDYFPKSEIYSFEPGPRTYLELSKNHGDRKNVHLERMAISSENGQREFLENDYPNMSSFLELDRLGWGKITNKAVVDTVTVDAYCQSKRIPRIDILKADTQGFELEVFKGALQMMKSNNIQLVYFEYTFSDMYKGLPSFSDIYKLLTENSFRLVNFYNFQYQEGMLGWGDLLFVNVNYNKGH